MSWVIYVLIAIAIAVLATSIYFYYKKRQTKQEEKLVRFLKKNGGEVNPRWVKDELKVSRAWLESVASRLEEKGKVVRWGWRAKSLICLKRSVVGSEKRVVALLKKNDGVMEQRKVWKTLGIDEEGFGWRMVRKLEAKGVLWRQTHGKKNLLVLRDASLEKRFAKDTASPKDEGKAWGSVKGVDLNKREKRMVKILKKNGGEMLDVGLKVRMRDSGDVIKSLTRKGVVFRWGAKKRNVCLKSMLNEEEVVLVEIMKDNDGRMMWRDLVEKSGYCGKGFHRVLDKLEVKGRIVR